MQVIFDIELVSLESVFQYESNNNNYVLYNRGMVAQFFWSKFILKCTFTLFTGMEGVLQFTNTWSSHK
jgi:hypothetical protein